jgi:predicted HAD superfamily hydrolase
MKAYIGTKIVNAEPMEEVDFFVNVKKQELISGRDNRPGYLVMYEDGYQSWSPKETFERAYREVTDEEKEMIGSL